MTNHTGFTLALTFLFLPTIIVFAQDFERHPEAPGINGIVYYILKGDSLEEAKPYIYAGAMFIDGANQMELYEALFGPNKSTTFQLERNRFIAQGWLSIGKGDNAAIAIVKTASKDSKSYTRFHSVFLIRLKNGEWAIKYWHTSS